MKGSTFLDLEKSGLIVKIEKIDDKTYFDLVKTQFSPVMEDYYFMMILDRFYQKHKFNLPRIYATLYTLYGLHNGYDDYKCSFSYRFKLTLVKDKDSIFTYLLHIMDMKGNPPYFTFYRELGQHELDKKGRYVEHIDAEFSKEAMQEFMAQFVGHLWGTFNGLKETFNTPFFRTVAYDYTIYGFEDGEFFEDCYYREDTNDDEDDEADNDDTDNDDDDDDDYGTSDYYAALEMYKNNPKMKGNMSKRYD
jgi:hypothetical protein